jgi:putative endonuclease
LSKTRLTDSRRTTGQCGEALAAAYLERKGYGIIARNWRCTLGEIDLIAVDGPVLVFVEVRTRRAATYALAEESITHRKQQRLIQLAESYLYELDAAATPWLGGWRIDVVALRIHADQHADVRHLRNAIESL